MEEPSVHRNSPKPARSSPILVTSKEDMTDNIRRFYWEFDRNAKNGNSVLIDTSLYFVYDPISGWFAPATYAMVANATLLCNQPYSTNEAQIILAGSELRTKLETVCGPAINDSTVLQSFQDWLSTWGIKYVDQIRVYPTGEITDSPVLSTFCLEITNLNVARERGTGKPYRYKPLMLLAAIRAILEDQPLVYSNPLRKYYQEFQKAIGIDVANANLPFYHLMGDGFWQVMHGSEPIPYSGANSISNLNGTYASIEEKRGYCIKNQFLRPIVIEAIKEKWFTADEWQSLCNVWPGLAEVPDISRDADNTSQTTSEAQSVVAEKEEEYVSRTKKAAFFLVPTFPPQWDWEAAMGRLIDNINRSGFYFEPWQIAAYITALRTKPFVILAGISGTGKTKLPHLVAEALGMKSVTIPVRPDWTDSSDLQGYTDLQGAFRPGTFLKVAHQAQEDQDTTYVVVLDEMNLARVEHYLAEVLSRIEERRIVAGTWQCDPLLSVSTSDPHDEWHKVVLPPNLALVGTVNMDESTHGFSRKVLDRAFTLEMSDVELQRWGTQGASITPEKWPVAVMLPRYTTLAQVSSKDDQVAQVVKKVISTLETLNIHLWLAQLQVGYRVRDEIALFALNAKEIERFFMTSNEEPVDPLDLAISMKVLPRIVGGSGAVRRTLVAIIGWAVSRNDRFTDSDADEITARWQNEGRPSALSNTAFPRCAARACLMWERINDEGFTSYWL
jgi:hypothetical protein